MEPAHRTGVLKWTRGGFTGLMAECNGIDLHRRVFRCFPVLPKGGRKWRRHAQKFELYLDVPNRSVIY